VFDASVGWWLVQVPRGGVLVASGVGSSRPGGGVGHDQVGLLQQGEEPRTLVVALRIKVWTLMVHRCTCSLCGRCCRVVRTGDDLRVDLSIPLKTSVFGGQVRGPQQALGSVGSGFEVACLQYTPWISRARLTSLSMPVVCVAAAGEAAHQPPGDV
jgi:hypothetical protein